MEVWIGRDGQRHGPYKEEDVRQWLRSGQIAGHDLGWYEGLADWQPLSVLFPDALAATPPPFAPAAPVPASTAAALQDYAGFWKRVLAYVIDAGACDDAGCCEEAAESCPEEAITMKPLREIGGPTDLRAAGAARVPTATHLQQETHA